MLPTNFLLPKTSIHLLAPPPSMYTPQILPSFILTTIFISFYIPSSLSQQYEPNCTTLYTCGQNLPPIGYPFSGHNRDPSCGLPGFELTCREQDNTTTIAINSQIYRVLEINPIDRSIHLAGELENVCPQQSVSAALNDTLFGYDSDQVQFLNIYYSCPLSFNIPNRETIKCSENGNTDDGSGFYLNKSFTPEDLQLCQVNVGVPVNRTLFQEFENNNERISLQDLIGRGFRVEYKYDEEACLKCEDSGGICWSGTNTSRHSCLCRDRISFTQCSVKGDQNIGLKVGIAVFAAIVLLAVLLVYACCKKYSFLESLSFWKSRSNNDKQIEVFITQCGFSTPKRYKFYDIKKMTNSFKDELGKGGFGSVFKGMLQDGSLVAVKILKESKGNGEEFINEVASIGRTSHVNIVALLGFCYEGKKRALVYEFMPNGSLEKFLNHNIPTESRQHIGVEKLFEIAVGIARGLEYLHRGCSTRILHFDIKPHNILLDKDFCPKISDFGLAKIHSREESIVSMVEARGTIGYIAPEVFNRNFGGVSHKSDVYSYGMMLLEMVGGRKNTITRPNHSSEIYFPQWIYKQLELEEDLRMPVMENEIARKMIIVGLWCIQPNPTERPSIRKVVEMLEGIDALQIPPNPIFSPSPHLPVTSSIILESSISFE